MSLKISTRFQHDKIKLKRRICLILCKEIIPCSSFQRANLKFLSWTVTFKRKLLTSKWNGTKRLENMVNLKIFVTMEIWTGKSLIHSTWILRCLLWLVLFDSCYLWSKFEKEGFKNRKMLKLFLPFGESNLLCITRVQNTTVFISFLCEKLMSELNIKL